MRFLSSDQQPTDDIALARQRMIERQLEGRGIHEAVVLDAMAKVPREEFVPQDSRSFAYNDGAMSIGMGQTISQPYMVAIMTQHLVTPGVASGKKLDRVLEVGAGSGYQAAVLSYIAHEVITIERVPELANNAAQTLEKLGYHNVKVVAGDGSLGYRQSAPYKGILVAAAAPTVPDALKEQLAPGGRLVVPVGSRGLQQLAIVRFGQSGFGEEHGTSCVFVPLIGEQGWND